MTENSIQALIFDMDGLLFDTETLAFDNWLKAGRVFGYDIPESLLMDCIGRDLRGSRHLFETTLGADFPFDEIRELRIQYAEDVIRRHGVPLKAGVAELFEWRDGAGPPKAVATSTGRGRAEFLLKTAGLFDHFDTVVTGEDVEKGKPEPDIFLLAAKRLNASPARCVVFEDSDSGVRAAHRAGMMPILIPDMTAPTDEILGLARRVCASLTDARRIIRDMM